MPLQEYTPCPSCYEPEAARQIVADKIARLFKLLVLRSSQAGDIIEHRKRYEKALESSLIRSQATYCPYEASETVQSVPHCPFVASIRDSNIPPAEPQFYS